MIKKKSSKINGKLGGRPSKKGRIDLKMLEKLAAYGLTDVQIANILEISPRTLDNYKKDNRFLRSLKGGKEIADLRVERSLYERATGYSHPEDKIFQHNGKPVIVPTVKHYPPDVTACIFWLKNRCPEEWRDTKAEVNVNNTNVNKVSNNEIKPEEVNKDEIKKRVLENYQILKRNGYLPDSA